MLIICPKSVGTTFLILLSLEPIISQLYIVSHKDIILIAAFVIIAVIAFVVINHFVKKDGAFVQIKVDGQVVNTIPVNQNETLTIEGYQGGSNIVTIENGGVTMTDADCPDKLCVKTGRISKTGETIVCLPHRVVVEIIGAAADDSGVDSIVR